MLGNADIADNLQRLFPGQDGDAGITFAFGTAGINLVAVDALQRFVDLVGLGLGFLQQNAVGIKQLKRFGKAFALHSANAVDIPGDYFHARVPSDGLEVGALMGNLCFMGLIFCKNKRPVPICFCVSSELMLIVYQFINLLFYIFSHFIFGTKFRLEAWDVFATQ
jgi:hypothetical protein